MTDMRAHTAMPGVMKTNVNRFDDTPEFQVCCPIIRSARLPDFKQIALMIRSGSTPHFTPIVL